ncbi:hypothetical protein RCO28_12210 [Streptomyces sp. LHD-70]|uniref:hypothetical protein n=1 Tax=Streptomyces sp. LHD-70 TaxID=3072140 RepID=UPI00280CBB21|nr:hypothetical protein [Streptomyces sp. LHD-70]MDQ8703246.1 hypothetical protein [Streptomyces sp. LHD-70]
MRSGHKTMTGFVTILFALLIVIVGLCSEWPLWVWSTAFGLLVLGTAIALLLFRRPKPLIPYEHQLEPEAPLPPVERWECVIRNVALPSLSEDYDFLFTATIRWIPQDVDDDAPGINAGGLAVDAVLERARCITQQESAHRSSLVQHRLNGELAIMQLDGSGRVATMAERVQLTLSDADRERLEKLATVRKNEAVWEHERKWEQSKRAYLGDDVLKTPGSAVVWWLAKNEEKVDKAVADIGLLAELSSAAHDQPVPEGFHRFVPDLAAPAPSLLVEEQPPWPSTPRSPYEYVDFIADHCGLDEDDPRRALFIERMAKAAKGAGLDEIGDAFLRLLDDFATAHDSENEEPPDTGDEPFGL